MNKLSGLFDSAYTMSSDKRITVTSDRINFATTNETAVGLGRRDDNGLRMRLFLGVGSVPLTGIWEERDETNNLKFGGPVEFVTDGPDRFVGYWSMHEGEAPASGTWVLIKNLGHTAGQS